MLEEDKHPESERGPFSYENWLAASQGKSLTSTLEYPLFTDAHIVGMIHEGYGPYRFINTIASAIQTDSTRPAIILQLDFYLNWYDKDQPMDRTDAARYHAGGLQDEIAALTSLCLGIRLKAGGLTKMFQPDKDPKGLPTGFDFHQDPAPLRRPRNARLPKAIGTHSLADLEPFRMWPQLRPMDAVALMRAARFYQDAMWIAESEPELAWLMLVSAVETGAGRWRSTMEMPVDRLRSSRPNLETLLLEFGGDELVLRVAEEITPYMGSTKKFIDFVLEFVPSPPAERPPEWAQHQWDRNSIRRTMEVVYDYRSRALHGGIPFPYPMCADPIRVGNHNLPAEKSVGLAMATRDSVWVAKDTPILLHTFEYIARNVLLNWWSSMSKVTDDIRNLSEVST